MFAQNRLNRPAQGKLVVERRPGCVRPQSWDALKGARQILISSKSQRYSVKQIPGPLQGALSHRSGLPRAALEDELALGGFLLSLTG